MYAQGAPLPFSFPESFPFTFNLPFLHSAQENYSSALKLYLEAGSVTSVHFTQEVPPGVWTAQAYQRMLACCTAVQLPAHVGPQHTAHYLLLVQMGASEPPLSSLPPSSLLFCPEPTLYPHLFPGHPAFSPLASLLPSPPLPPPLPSPSTKAIVLCQYWEPVDYELAFSLIRDTNMYVRVRCQVL